MSISRKILIAALFTAVISCGTGPGASPDGLESTDSDLMARYAERAKSLENTPVATINESEAGSKLDIRPFILPGKRTIFAFFSDDCGACEELDPVIVELVRRRPELVLRRINIDRPGTSGIDFFSPVARQYGLMQLPHFLIFDESGAFMASGETAMTMIIKWFRESDG